MNVVAHTILIVLTKMCLELLFNSLTLYAVYSVILNSFNLIFVTYKVGVDRYVFFRADADTDHYRSSRPITDILNRYTCLV